MFDQNLKCSFLCLCLCLCLACVRLCGEENSANVATPQQLVEQLNADDFDARKRAESALEKLGEKARAALLLATQTGNADVKASAAALLSKLAAATLKLHVYDGAGKPVSAEGTAVFSAVKSKDEDRTKQFKTAADGTADIRLEALGAQSLELKFKAWDVPESGLLLEAREGLNEAFVELRQFGSAAGKVFGADGAALKDARVRLYSGLDFVPEILEQQIAFYETSAPADEALSAACDEKGAWKVNVAPGVYSCVISADGYFPIFAGLIRVHENAAAELQQVRLIARRSGSLEIALVKPDGNALEKSSVRIELEPILAGLKDKRAAQAVKNFKLANQVNAGIPDESVETDEKGVVASDNVSPGKYNLRVYLDESGVPLEGEPYFQKEVEIKAGETLRLAQTPGDKSVRVYGRIADQEGGGIGGIAVQLMSEATFQRFEDRLSLGHDFGQALRFPAGVQALEGTLSTTTKNDGVFRINAVPPGKYVAFLTNHARHAYIFGIDVKAGKQTQVPDAVWEEFKGAGPEQNVHGTVVDAAGRAVVNPALTLLTNGQKVGINGHQGGNFAFTLPREKGGAANTNAGLLIIRAPGFQPLLAQGPFDRERYVLQPQKYGVLKVVVQDDAGKALSNAKVFAADSWEKSGEANSTTTDSMGVARLEGLAAGPRRIDAILPGYFLSGGSVQVAVKPEAENAVTLKMEHGVTLRGKVRAPEGVSLKGAMTQIQPEFRYAAVAADGAFAFEGVTPGTKHLRAVGPRMVFENLLKLELPADLKQVAEKFEQLELRLARSHALVLDCGGDYANCQGTLVPANRDAGSVELESLLDNQQETVDASGRIEFRDVPPGKYLLSIQSNKLFTAEGVFNFSSVRADPRAGPFDAQPLESPAALEKLPAAKAEFLLGTGAAKMRLSVVLAPGCSLSDKDDGRFNFELKLSGPRGSARLPINNPKRFVGGPHAEPAVFGKLPEWYHSKPPNELGFTMLIAGEYKLTAQDFNYPDDATDIRGIVAGIGPPVELGRFTIKDGETLECGEIKFDLGKLFGKDRGGEELRRLMAPQDRGADFDP